MKRDIVVLVVAVISAVIVGAFIFVSNGGNLASVFSTVTDNGKKTKVVQFTEIARGSQSAIDRRVNYFITSRDQFNRLWETIDASGTPPAVDFETHAVIAVFAGQEPTASYGIKVAKIEDTDKRMVSITLAKPDDDCTAAQVVTMPYQLIVLPTTSLPLAHEDEAVEINCSS